MPVKPSIAAFHDDLVAWRRDFHAHPELGFEEHRTSAIVAQKLESWGIEVERGLAGTGLVGTLRAGSGNRAIGPPPGTSPAPTSHCERIAFSRLAKRMSQASDSSLPTPVARPRMEAMDTTGARLSRTSMSGNACRPVGPRGMDVESSSGARKL